MESNARVRAAARYAAGAAKWPKVEEMLDELEKLVEAGDESAESETEQARLGHDLRGTLGEDVLGAIMQAAAEGDQ